MLWLFLACARVVGGSDQEPARIDLTMPPGTIFDGTPLDLRPIVLNRNNERIDVLLTVAAVPETVATATVQGVVTCRSSGNAVVQLVAGGTERRVYLHCRNVARLEGPGPVILGPGQRQSLPVQVLDQDDQPVTDAIPTLVSSDPKVVRVEDGGLLAVGTGTAVVTASAAGHQVEIPVEVRQAAQDAAWTVGEGQVQSWYMPAGRWRIGVNVRAGGPVSVVVREGNCASETPKKRHSLNCVLPSMGRLQIRNPLDGGGDSQGSMILQRR